MYLAPACVIWLLIGIMLFEWPNIQTTQAWLLMAGRPLPFAVASVLGFVVNSLTYTVVLLASSVTLKVSVHAAQELVLMFTALI